MIEESKWSKRVNSYNLAVVDGNWMSWIDDEDVVYWYMSNTLRKEAVTVKPADMSSAPYMQDKLCQHAT